jgi:hypothetical protein
VYILVMARLTVNRHQLQQVTIRVAEIDRMRRKPGLTRNISGMSARYRTTGVYGRRLDQPSASWASPALDWPVLDIYHLVGAHLVERRGTESSEIVRGLVAQDVVVSEDMRSLSRDGPSAGSK